MKKVTFKLKPVEAEGIVRQIEQAVFNPTSFGYENNDTDKLILAALTELHCKIRNSINIYDTCATVHKIKVNVSHAMAFMVHFRALPDGVLTEPEVLTMNTLIGQIDQQTLPIKEPIWKRLNN